MPPILDFPTLAAVIAGTLLVTLARSGGQAVRSAAATVWQLTLRPLPDEALRARLAPLLARIEKDGLLRCEAAACGDAEFDRLTASLVAARSVEAMQATYAEMRERRLSAAQDAVDVFSRMAQVAPVVGLAGTLCSLASLAQANVMAGDLLIAVGVAVLTTLYGVVLAHFVADPLEELVQRRASKEDRQREALVGWLCASVARVTPRPTYRAVTGLAA